MIYAAAVLFLLALVDLCLSCRRHANRLEAARALRRRPRLSSAPHMVRAATWKAAP